MGGDLTFAWPRVEKIELEVSRFHFFFRRLKKGWNAYYLYIWQWQSKLLTDISDCAIIIRRGVLKWASPKEKLYRSPLQLRQDWPDPHLKFSQNYDVPPPVSNRYLYSPHCSAFHVRDEAHLESLFVITVNLRIVCVFIIVLVVGTARLKQKFGFIKRVDKGWITTVKDLESWRFER